MKKIALFSVVLLTIVSCSNTESTINNSASANKKTIEEEKYPTDNPSNYRDRNGGEIEIK